MTTKRYNLKYTLSIDDNNGDGFSREEILKAAKKDGDIGACDAFMFISIAKPEDGSFSIMWSSGDVKNKKPCNIDNLDFFKVWSLLSKQLSEVADFDWQRKIAQDAFSEIRKHILNTH